MFCEKCGKELREGVKFCPGCGKNLEEQREKTINPVTRPSDTILSDITPSVGNTAADYASTYRKKSKVVAGILGIFLGGFGVHKFYMGNMKMGIIYILFCWTYIPTFVGLIEGIIYLIETDEKFNSRYV